MLCCATRSARVRRELRGQSRALAAWPRRTAAPRWSARTLTQHAVPTTFGAQGRAVADRDPRRVRRPGARWSSRCRSAARRHPGRAVELGDVDDLARSRDVAWRPSADAAALAHHPRAVTRLGDAAGRLHRRLGADRQRRAHPVAARDRRARRGRRRRVVDDAAQGQPGALGAGPPCRAGRTAARRHPAPRGSRAGRRARRRRLARRVGDAARRWSAAPSSPARRQPSCWPGSRSTPTGWPPRSPPPATTYSPSSAAWPTGRHARPATTSGAADAFLDAVLAPPAYSRRTHHDHHRSSGSAPRRAAAARARPLARHLRGDAVGRVRRRLTDAFDVVAWDLPGHGNNRGPAAPIDLAMERPGRATCSRRRRVGGAVLLRRRLGRRRGRAPAAARRARTGCSARSLLCTGAKIGDDAECGRERIDQVRAVRHPGAGRRPPRSAGSARASWSGSRTGLGAAARAERRRRRGLRRGLRRARGVRRARPARRDRRTRCWPSPGADDVATPPDKLREIADGVQRRPARRARRRRTPGARRGARRGGPPDPRALPATRRHR